MNVRAALSSQPFVKGLDRLRKRVKQSNIIQHTYAIPSHHTRLHDALSTTLHSYTCTLALRASNLVIAGPHHTCQRTHADKTS